MPPDDDSDKRVAVADVGVALIVCGVADYESLITNARAMGRDDVVALLRQNLEQEQHTLDEVKRSAAQLATASAV